jgi:hypothetical protein
MWWVGMNLKVHATNFHADAPLKVPGLTAVQPNRDVGLVPGGQAGPEVPFEEAPLFNKGFPGASAFRRALAAPSCYPIATNKAGTTAFEPSFAL